MEMALTFNDVTLSPVHYENSLWIRAVELARALGFKREDQAAKIYRVHADEFMPDMAQVVEIVDNAESAFPVKTLLFSPRGCHLLSMFARTSVAKDFRKWVLDVLDRLNEENRVPQPGSSSDAPLTPDQQCTLRALVKARVESIPSSARSKGIYPQIWGRFNNHFRIARYSQLPQSRMSEAIEYLTKMEIVQQAVETAKPKALPSGYPPLAEAGASCMAEILSLRGNLFKASVDLKAVMQMGLSHGNGQSLGEVQRAFSQSLGQSVDAFFMSINHNMIAIEHMFRAFMEAEKLIHG